MPGIHWGLANRSCSYASDRLSWERALTGVGPQCPFDERGQEGAEQSAYTGRPLFLSYLPVVLHPRPPRASAAEEIAIGTNPRVVRNEGGTIEDSGEAVLTEQGVSWREERDEKKGEGGVGSGGQPGRCWLTPSPCQRLVVTTPGTGSALRGLRRFSHRPTPLGLGSVNPILKRRR